MWIKRFQEYYKMSFNSGFRTTNFYFFRSFVLFSLPYNLCESHLIWVDWAWVQGWNAARRVKWMQNPPVLLLRLQVAPLSVKLPTPGHGENVLRGSFFETGDLKGGKTKDVWLQVQYEGNVLSIERKGVNGPNCWITGWFL